MLSLSDLPDDVWHHSILPLLCDQPLCVFVFDYSLVCKRMTRAIREAHKEKNAMLRSVKATFPCVVNWRDAHDGHTLLEMARRFLTEPAPPQMDVANTVVADLCSRRLSSFLELLINDQNIRSFLYSAAGRAQLLAMLQMHNPTILHELMADRFWCLEYGDGPIRLLAGFGGAANRR